jgi:trimethylamine:corrinoid methyltransferase-like protein
LSGSEAVSAEWVAVLRGLYVVLHVGWLEGEIGCNMLG